MAKIFIEMNVKRDVSKCFTGTIISPRMTFLVGNKFVANLKKNDVTFFCFLIKWRFEISQGKISLNNQMKNIALNVALLINTVESLLM